MADQEIKRRALRVIQDGKHPLYMFTLSAKELLRVADVSRVSRTEAGKLIGYQRPEVRRHVQSIVDYLDSGSVLFPNSIILALSSASSFVHSRGPNVSDGLAESGTLIIPVAGEGQPKPAWIVDGQQRALALARAKNADLPVPVNAFVADEISLQKDQFLRINSTRPLPRGLITELLPDVDTILPPQLEAKKAPARLCEVLNNDPHSPFYKLIQLTSTPPRERKEAVVTGTVVVAMIAESLKAASGCLYPYTNAATRETDYEAIRRILFAYWNAVRHTFPEAWGKRSQQSRLMHGIGIRSMGRLMDRVMVGIDPFDSKAETQIRKQLTPLRNSCRWTAGAWEGLGGMRWNALQNTPQDIELLSNHLVREYVAQYQRKAP
ncbi:DGQHR domain-containing protein DpdB [Hyalangium gracile]|uniref:DGQHR domain-containing protein DpdB n=1 Tax=Hyalangium gracile TaxID=394092 RepID=UPI001CCD76AA|nr:DGQHR domain-containing protein DpdB [Hyalangium gracile]